MRAVVIRGGAADPVVAVEDVEESMLEGDVLVAVSWAGVNFKDAMATRPGNRVARRDVLIGGVDLAGTVLDDPTGTFAPGTEVLGVGHGVGTSHHGGFAERARLPVTWLSALPAGLDARAAMVLGTAGWTAMASLLALEAHGIDRAAGPLLVTGAAGGVGSTAVALAAAGGYEVVASSGRPREHSFLAELGAQATIGRDAVDDVNGRVLGAERWIGAVDCVGGSTLAAILRTLRYGAAVAASGLTGGQALATSVFPFIVRAVSLLGIDSVQVDAATRAAVWTALADRFPAVHLERIVECEVDLEGVPAVLERIGRGEVRGRVVVRPH